MLSETPTGYSHIYLFIYLLFKKWDPSELGTLSSQVKMNTQARAEIQYSPPDCSWLKGETVIPDFDAIKEKMEMASVFLSAQHVTCLYNPTGPVRSLAVQISHKTLQYIVAFNEMERTGKKIGPDKTPITALNLLASTAGQMDGLSVFTNMTPQE